VSDWRLRHRTRLKQKESKAMREELEALLGVPVWGENEPVESAEGPDYGVVLIGNEPVAIVQGGPFLSVRGLLRYRPERRAVTVDMGAVRFVVNGADVMAPGIVAADSELQEGDWCWIRDERNRQPLAIGRMLVAGPQAVRPNKGKAVKAVHHIGDKLWEWKP
jgi:PUA-domain protein